MRRGKHKTQTIDPEITEKEIRDIIILILDGLAGKDKYTLTVKQGLGSQRKEEYVSKIYGVKKPVTYFIKVSDSIKYSNLMEPVDDAISEGISTSRGTVFVTVEAYTLSEHIETVLNEIAKRKGVYVKLEVEKS